MRRCKVFLLSFLTLYFVGGTTMHGGRTRAQDYRGETAARSSSAAVDPFLDPAARHWRSGQATHWRALLLQR